MDMHDSVSPPPLPSRARKRRIEITELAWSRKGLLLLTSLLGLAAGYLHYRSKDPVYRSQATVQIVEPYIQNLPLNGIETAPEKSSLENEIVVMRSERVLDHATRLGKLSELPQFASYPNESIASYLSTSAGLTVRPAMAGPGANVFNVSYQSTDPAGCRRVVQSVIDAYGRYLNEHQTNVGEETLALIQQARGEVLSRLEDLESQYDHIKQSSSLIFRDGQITSIHRGNAEKFLLEKQSLSVQRNRIESKYETAVLGYKDGVPIESLLLALGNSRDTVENVEVAEKTVVSSGQVLQRLRQENSSRADQLRESLLMPLELEAKQFAEEFGPGHPSVRSIEIRIASVKELIEKTAENEEELRRLADVEVALAEAEAGIKPDEDVDDSVNGKRESRLKRQLQLVLQAMQQELKSLDNQLQIVSDAYGREIQESRDEGAAEAKLYRLQRDIDRQQALYDRIVARLDEVNIMSGSQGLHLVVLNTPKLGDKIAPSMSRSLILYGLLGALAGFSLAYVLEMTDHAYHSAEQVSEHLSVPVIGHLSICRKRKRDASLNDVCFSDELHTFFHPKTSWSESFRAIRTALFFSNQRLDSKVMQVTSSVPGEGKSMIACNLAVSIAQSGKSVLLVDADLRRPRVDQVVGIDSERGLAWLLDEMKDREITASEEVADLLGEVVHETPTENLSVIVAGDRPHDPAEMLASSRLDRFLDCVRDRFDLIIIDTPPLLAVTDPSNVAPRVDTVLMVIRLNKGARPNAARAIRMLETLEANVAGVIVNGVGSRRAGRYGAHDGRDGYYNGGYYKYAAGYSYGSDGSGRFSEYYEDQVPGATIRKIKRPRGAKANGKTNNPTSIKTSSDET
tara:strand:- start:73958 stop:76519 length:2562 start_codon:yes stop_codon:yes gene_type:complete